MRQLQTTLALVFVIGAASLHATATTLDVRVTNVADSAGSVHVAICTAEQWLKPNCALGVSRPAETGEIVLTIPNVPPGVYAVLAHHDRDDNGKVNRDLFGRPTEGVGFSRDAPTRFGPPRFEDAEIQIAGDHMAIAVRLRFEPHAEPL